MKKKEIIELIKIAGALIKKEDPDTGISFEKDTVLAIPKVEKYNRLVYELLNELLKKEEKEDSRKKVAFFISEEEKKNITVTEDAVSISKFCYRINENVPPDMKKLRAADVVRGLEELGYLYEETQKNTILKLPTKKGEKIGIKKNEKETDYGVKYIVNLYSENAQRFVLNNLEDIILAGKN